MPDDDFRVAELMLKGYKCSHILVQIGLDEQAKDNPDLLRAISGLANGMGCGLACGVLTGGCCLIAMYAGMDTQKHEEHELLYLMLEEYTDWFRSEYGERYGGTDCSQIIRGDPRLRNERCPGLILAAVQKAREILEANGFELDGISGRSQG
ncbi:DVU_1555 family C-GCAxxG-C-C protein [Uliginosibacterium gangwonense]|uniref:DVU_1555 family C-GCAxxG-C-C protein n=1 Tax=Uliginosibacterium gangwonense TaxID=392736 RepID=UPI000368A0A0|nr:DV_1555 family C-GCAxxG-C-C protein [Uliginosibacterium gangwonense]